ncbi:uncharacterized protein FIBRA_07035 [Fibroporia radiculosa]|uniref:Major facilitator superfamily (MFS) profile domain-containing protein n=1 Tax=Fibroporia radiculosa TaxID=599839 RepID=J4I018_9APHY|nr:uncharacterized protein FIBRA_07035 [Fibroporia radiculosa]CCM04842.1 predicted protein [Fibroporia radiculosa]
MLTWRTARKIVWGDVPETKAERTLLLKIDWFILSYCCLMYFTNYLDRSNVANAYVSGMKEDLNMYGTQYNVSEVVVDSMIGMIPNNLMLQVVSPRIWFPFMQIIWGVLTFGSSAVKNVEQMYAIRFFQGVSEASTFVGTHYILGSWYKPGELGKRSGIFTSSGLIGTLFSGVLQGAVYQHLNGVSGRSGWRWLFIIDGVITLPIALYGFFVFPDVPATTHAFYLTDEERHLASTRLRTGRRDKEVISEEDSTNEGAHGRPTWALARRVLGRWRWYGCSLLFAISGECESFGSNNLMGQWLSAIGGYSVEEVDYYPSGVTAVGIVSTLLCATWTDATRSRARWPVLVYMALAVIVASICLLVWRAPIGLKFFAYYLAGASYSGQATTFAWANQICAGDDQERAIVLASMNMWNNAVNAWWPLLFYPATDAPEFRKGMWAMIGTGTATLLVTFFVWFLERRERRRHERLSVEGLRDTGQEVDARVDEKESYDENGDKDGDEKS